MNNIIPSGEITDRHWQLYLMADPEKRMVMRYLQRAKKFEIDDETGSPIASVLLLMTRPATIEIMNLAVLPQFRRQGLAKQLIDFAADYAREFHCTNLEVGTATTSFGPLALYQACGFRVVGVEPDFFTTNYQQPFRENGLPVQDMLRLRKSLATS